MNVSFRRLADDDLPILHRWLNEPGVVRWWEGDDVSWEGVVRDYGSANPDPTEHWIASVDHGSSPAAADKAADWRRDIGWSQCWAVADEPEMSGQWWPLGVERSAAGIDYLVGDPGDRGRGVGSAMIRAFVDQVVFGLHPHWTQVCASPYAANGGSCRALHNAGFRFVGVVEDKEGPCHLMALDRAVKGQQNTNG